MDEMREGLRAFREGLRKAMETVMEEEKNVITFGDILDLLGRDDTVAVSVNGDLLGRAGCVLWKPLEDREVESIGIDGTDGLEVWLKEETEDDET